MDQVRESLQRQTKRCVRVKLQSVLLAVLLIRKPAFQANVPHTPQPGDTAMIFYLLQ